ncbi:MAG: hypothetical protein ABI921_08750 [Panacibacter sp.]
MGNLGLQELLLLGIVGGIIMAGIFFLLTLQNALKTVSPENRAMEPGNVWLLLIPLFNIYYMFIVVNAIAASLNNEYQKFGVIKNENPTYNIGIAWCITQIASSILQFFSIPYLSIITLLFWIIYWVKVNEHKNEIVKLQNANDPLHL